MKELSIEEKAKSYDEVRKKIAIRFGSNVADEIFSQYEMSEDERIRREIIDFLKHTEGQTIPLQKYNAWIAWLEKQGEQKPLETTKSEEFLKELSLSLQIQAYLNTASDELYAKGKPLYSEKRIEDIHRCMQMWAKLHNAYFLSSPEQKPVEWGEEDYTKLKTAITLLEHPAVISNNGEILEKTVDWLNSLKERCLPQPKQEWSEEDNAMLISIENILIGRGHSFHDKEINWLKSLRPQNRWKPSDEQMEALMKARNDT